MDLYGKIAYTNREDFIFQVSERPKTFRFFQGVRLLPMPSLKKLARTDKGAGTKKSKTRIERSNFRWFSANFRVLGPPSKNSKCHNSMYQYWELDAHVWTVESSHPYIPMTYHIRKNNKIEKIILVDPKQTVTYFKITFLFIWLSSFMGIG